MAVRIASNQASLQAQRRLTQNTAELTRVFDRLSSGLRINRAVDDAAGLAIAESLRVDTRVANQGIRNFNDGLALLAIADGALEQLSNIVIRLQELAEQAAQGTLGHDQRKALDDEAQALSEEYFRISRATTFNGISLFDGSVGQVQIQGGYGTNGGIRSGVGGKMGDGTFGSVGYYVDPGGVSLSANALGDLNGDGIFDLVTAGYDGSVTGVVYARLGNGDGTFASARSYAADPQISRDLVLADVNRDGILDVLTSGNSPLGQGTATVRLGRGDGTFGALRTYLAEGSDSASIEAGDVNNDGILDLVTAGNGGGSGRLTVRFGTGDGTFGAAVSYTAEATTTNGLSLADVNNDGILDAVTGGFGAGAGRVTIRLGLGNGTFGGAVSYSIGGINVAELAVGDINGDNILDVATGGTGMAVIFLGRGDGTFSSFTSYTAESGDTFTVSLGDFNGDGMLDLVTAGYDSGGIGSATVRLGQGNGTFGSATTYVTEEVGTYDIALGDVNGDGVQDLITSGAGIFTLVAETHVRLSNTRDGVGPLLPFSLRYQSDARQAMGILSRARNSITAQRGTIGAFQSRLFSGVNNLGTAVESFATAEGQIRDVDVAVEASQLVKSRILQQAAAAVLAQANTQPRFALTLLG